MADDPWAVVSIKPAGSDPTPAVVATASPAAPAPKPAPTPTPAASADPWAVVSQQPAAAIPTESVRATRPPAPVTEQTGDVPSQQPQTGGDFFDYARGAPPALEPIVQRAASKYGVPLAVAHWVGTHESNWDTTATGPETSSGRAKGAWQIMDGTAKDLGLADPHDFAASTDAAMRYLRHLADKNGGDWMKAVEAYGTFSSGMGARRDAKLKSGFQSFFHNSTGQTPATASAEPAETDRYAGWDTADAPDDETTNDPEWVPFRDEPGTVRGNILPVMRDAAGNYSLAWPDITRAPFRGVIEGGQEARGVRPVDDPQARGDIAAAAGFGVRPANKLFATPEERAAETLRMYNRTPQGRAENMVAQRLNEGVRGGGAMVNPPIEHGPPAVPGAMPPLALPTTPADNVIANLDRMREGGAPGTLMDVGGPGVKGMAGSAARKPGPAQGIIRSTMEGRDADAGVRAQANVRRFLTAGASAYRTARDLIARRSEEGDPLYKKAFEGGSLAPLKDQFQAAWVEAGKVEKQAAADVEVAQSQLNTALAKSPVTGGNVYSESAANEAIRAARRNLQIAQQAQERAAAAKEEILTHLRAAQYDIENETPGAVWNPRIQQFLNLPVIRRGLRRGYEIQRNDAVADNVPFNPTEYAMTPDGKVIRVPNMRTLNVAKKGLDAIIAENRDEFGRLNEYGVSVDKVRRSFLNEIDAISDDYKAARRVWAGHSASLDALKWGKNIQRLHPEQIAEEFANMSDGEKEFARLGLADTLLEKIGKTSFTGDEAKALINNQWTKDQLQPLFRTQEDFTRYVESVAHERLMKDTQNEVLAGSQTAARQEADKGHDIHAAAHTAHSIIHALSGNLGHSIRSAVQAYRYLGLRPDEALTEAIARTLTDPSRVPEVVNGQFQYPVPTMRITPGLRFGSPRGEPMPPAVAPP